MSSVGCRYHSSDPVSLPRVLDAHEVLQWGRGGERGVGRGSGTQKHRGRRRCFEKLSRAVPLPHRFLGRTRFHSIRFDSLSVEIHRPRTKSNRDRVHQTRLICPPHRTRGCCSRWLRAATMACFDEPRFLSDPKPCRNAPSGQLQGVARVVGHGGVQQRRQVCLPAQREWSCSPSAFCYPGAPALLDSSVDDVCRRALLRLAHALLGIYAAERKTQEKR